MSSETTYLETIVNYLRRTRGSSSDLLDQIQLQALQLFSDRDLPSTRDESYRYTPLSYQMKQSDLYSSTSVDNLEPHLPDVPFSEKSIHIPLVNNRPPPEGLPRNLPQGIHISSLSEAQELYPELLKKYAFSSPLKEEDAFVMLNEAAFEYGLFVYVEAGISLDLPLLLQQHSQSKGGSLVSHPRSFVYLDRGASLSLIDLQSSHSEGGICHQNNVCEVFCAEGSELRLYKLQEDDSQTLRVDHTYVEQEAGSQLLSYVFSSGGSLIRNNLYVRLCDEKAEAHLHGLYMCDQRSHIDNHSTLDHCSAHSYSDQSYKGILSKQSRGVFNGRIFMRPGSVESTAYQSNKNLLLSSQAKLHAKPQLEIWVDDVRCSHGCTVGQLSDEQLHYLQSRGIPRSLATEMLLYAFGGESMEHIPEQGLRSYLQSWLSDQCHSMM